MIADFVPVARVVSRPVGPEDLRLRPPAPATSSPATRPSSPSTTWAWKCMENSELDLYEHYKKPSRGTAHRGASRRTWRRSSEKATSIPASCRARPVRARPDDVGWSSNLGAQRVRGLRQQVLAGLRDHLRLRALLRERPPRRQGIPVACEVDIYGALSEYMPPAPPRCPRPSWTSTTPCPTTWSTANKKTRWAATLRTTSSWASTAATRPASCMKSTRDEVPAHHEARLLEPDSEPDITRGTLEGQIKARRHHALPPPELRPTPPCAPTSPRAKCSTSIPSPSAPSACSPIPEMARFYRHVLIGKRYPHHARGRLRPRGQGPLRGLQAPRAWRTSPRTSRPPCPMPARIPSRRIRCN